MYFSSKKNKLIPAEKSAIFSGYPWFLLKTFDTYHVFCWVLYKPLRATPVMR